MQLISLHFEEGRVFKLKMKVSRDLVASLHQECWSHILSRFGWNGGAAIQVESRSCLKVQKGLCHVMGNAEAMLYLGLLQQLSSLFTLGCIAPTPIGSGSHLATVNHCLAPEIRGLWSRRGAWAPQGRPLHPQILGLWSQRTLENPHSPLLAIHRRAHWTFPFHLLVAHGGPRVGRGWSLWRKPPLGAPRNGEGKVGYKSKKYIRVQLPVATLGVTCQLHWDPSGADNRDQLTLAAWNCLASLDSELCLRPRTGLSFVYSCGTWLKGTEESFKPPSTGKPLTKDT